MKKITLTQSEVAYVSDEDYEKIKKHKWRIERNRNTCYAKSQIKNANGEWKTIWMHRLIMDAPIQLQVDHIDGNGLNNTRKNLRLCASFGNNANRRKTVGISRYKGVTKHRKSGKWMAYIKKDKKMYNLGLFEIEEDAAKVYNIRALEFWKEFARINTINDTVIIKE